MMRVTRLRLALRRSVMAGPHAAAQPPTLRALSSASSPPSAADEHPDEHQSRGDVAAGLPDFIHAWGPGRFKKGGYALAAFTAGSCPLALMENFHSVSLVVPPVLALATGLYWKIGLSDLAATSALRRNFPLLCNFRYVLESLRPEIQQYFIEDEVTQVPFSRAMRNVIYKRSKGLADATALGTRRQVYAEGYEWLNHSMFPVPAEQVADRVMVGGPDCLQPYSASLLNISAMSFGALSGSAVSALNLGAKRGGFYHNTGEGGISKFHRLGADIVWNVGTGYFACGNSDGPGGSRQFDPEQFEANANLECVKMVEIKLSQGAKPAHGGMLPASKITATIAEARGLGAPPYSDCNSPPQHSAFSSPTGLMLFIAKLRSLSGGKPIGFKLCVGNPAEFAALCHAMIESGVRPDFITVDGAEGGTGAAPPEFQDSVGMPLGEGLRLIDSFLTGARLRKDIKLIAAGKVYHGASLVKTLALGADLTNCARAMMFSLGCIQALKCNSNTCPTGITTQKPELENGLDVPTKSARVAAFHKSTVHAAVELIGALGVNDSSKVGPDHVFKRESGIHVKSYKDMHAEYFPLIEEGALLGKELKGHTYDGARVVKKGVAEQTARWWQEGRAIYDERRAMAATNSLFTDEERAAIQ